MRIVGKKIILKIKKKNIGNRKLCSEIDNLISDLEGFEPSKQYLKDIREDADCVHSDGFYFFNINIHRTMILIVFDDNEATVVWSGSHDEYQNIFKGNKNTIEKWLRTQNLI